jgi:DnaJ-class molecular chaperone
MYKKIQKAKDLLLDDKRREMYDRFGITSDEEMAEKMGGMGGMGGMPGFPSGMGVNMHDLFSSFSGRS